MLEQGSFEAQLVPGGELPYLTPWAAYKAPGQV